MQQDSEGGPPAVLVALIKGVAFAAAFGLTGWLLYRIFRAGRRLRQTGEVEETRESTFSWSRANRDLSSLLAEWWSGLASLTGGGAKRPGQPGNPREFYHEMLALAARLGVPRWEWQTPKEHQRTLLGVLPGEPVGRIVDGFQLAHYGHVDLNSRELDRLRQDWASLTEFLAEQERGGKGF